MGEQFTVEYARRSRPINMKKNHFHNQYEIYFLVSGSVEYFVDGALYLLTAGSFALIPPGVLHRTVKYGDGAHERILIMVDPGFLTAFLEMDASLFDCFGRICVLAPLEPGAVYELACSALPGISKEKSKRRTAARVYGAAARAARARKRRRAAYAGRGRRRADAPDPGDGSVPGRTLCRRD